MGILSKTPQKATLVTHTGKNGSLPHLYYRHFRLRPRQDGDWASISDRQALDLINYSEVLPQL